jgi:hypothetical protein
MVVGAHHYAVPDTHRRLKPSMKRVIDGISYNTATALHVAKGEERSPAKDPGSWVDSWDLYRTKDGKFFVTRITAFEPAVGANIDVDRMAWLSARGRQELIPLSYDEAYMFVLGAKQGLWDERFTEISGVEVELFQTELFPSGELVSKLPRDLDEVKWPRVKARLQARPRGTGVGPWRPTKAAS